jgi:putative transposase
MGCHGRNRRRFTVASSGSANRCDASVMQDAKPESHTIWDCKYHIVWITKYRYPVMGGDVGQRARELLREIVQAHEMKIYAGSIKRDHVHMLIGIPPHLSVSRAVQYLKGKGSHKLLSEYQSLRKRYRKRGRFPGRGRQAVLSFHLELAGQFLVIAHSPSRRLGFGVFVPSFDSGIGH